MPRLANFSIFKTSTAAARWWVTGNSHGGLDSFLEPDYFQAGSSQSGENPSRLSSQLNEALFVPLITTAPLLSTVATLKIGPSRTAFTLSAILQHNRTNCSTQIPLSSISRGPAPLSADLQLLRTIRPLSCLPCRGGSVGEVPSFTGPDWIYAYVQYKNVRRKKEEIN